MSTVKVLHRVQDAHKSGGQSALLADLQQENERLRQENQYLEQVMSTKGGVVTALQQRWVQRSSWSMVAYSPATPALLIAHRPRPR